MATLKTKQRINFDYLYGLIKDNYIETKKLVELYEKWNAEKLTIGFTGHFSAGKSSMINAIIGEDLLPSSPIPTSANIVEIKHGNEQVIYHFNDRNYAIENEIDIASVKSLSKNGESVRSLTIQKPIPMIADSVTIMDTPGIDSSDDLEFKRTLDQVHLIDHFIYVMDYNHVQSEVNFNFLKQLEMKEVPYFIVVNQIDKHNEKEISFYSYKRSLINSCQSWGLNPEKIFYTSLMDIDHELNELQPFISEINEIITNKENLIEQKLFKELSFMIDRYVNSQFNLSEESTQLLINKKSELDHISNEINSLKNEKQLVAQTILDDITKTLSNAYLMDYDTREAARSYLEALQPKFKVGGLFSKKKTEVVRISRTQSFISRMNERIKTEMIWHIRSSLLSRIEKYNVHNDDLKRAVQEYNFDLTEDQIKKVMNPQANISGDYVLVFTEQLQSHIGQLIKHDIHSLLNDITTAFENVIEERINEKRMLLDRLNIELNDLKEVDSKVKEKEHKKAEIMDRIFFNHKDDLIKMELNKIKDEYKQIDLKSISTISQDDQKESVKTSKIYEDGKQQVEEIKLLAKNYLNEIEGVDYLEAFNQSISKRLNQMDQHNFTVALFGAFSAGKSSFANAWIGESILPVSPNPTTAAINRILPIDEVNKHGDVNVQLKSEELMVYQLTQIITPYTNEKFQDIKSLQTFLEKRWSELKERLSQTEGSFINAFLSGYEKMHSLLGKQTLITLEEFPKYVTDEKISCYVERIDIYYDCELTRKGVTLVDTPGADSIHARHTNVSMHYVKHSDLIVYVNYYNHAFSRADREFLIQLGQVKDAFSLDKMFFILNASDLAKTDEELEMVQKYLVDQLQQYGINNPSIFAMSSIKLLNQPQLKRDDAQYSVFFKRFNEFLDGDAKQILANGLKYEIERLTEFLKNSLTEAQQEKRTQIDLLNKNKNQINAFEQWAQQFEHRPYLNDIEQEIEELTHYMHQRVMIQLIDFMKESINPSTIRSNGKKGREELKVAIKQLWSMLSQKLQNEFQTTNILLDKRLNRKIDEVTKELNKYIENQTEFSRVYFEEQKLKSASEATLLNQDHEGIMNHYLTLFKNKKEFFENQKVKELYSELEEQLSKEIMLEINQFNSIFKEHYKQIYYEQYSQIIAQFVHYNSLMIDTKEKLFNDPSLTQKFTEILSIN